MTQNPGDALRSAGITPVSPKEFLETRWPELVDELNNGRVDEAVAERLSQATGTSVRFWLNMQEAVDG